MSAEAPESPKGFTSRRNRAMAERLGRASIEANDNVKRDDSAAAPPAYIAQRMGLHSRRKTKRQGFMHTEVMPPGWKEDEDLQVPAHIAQRMNLPSRRRTKREYVHTSVIPPNWEHDNEELVPPPEVAERMNLPSRRWFKRQAGGNQFVPINRPAVGEEEDSGDDSDDSISSVSSDSDNDGIDSSDSSDSSDSEDDEDDEDSEDEEEGGDETIESSAPAPAKPSLTTLIPGAPGLAAPAPSSSSESIEDISLTETFTSDISSSTSSVIEVSDSSSASEPTDAPTNEPPVADSDAISTSDIIAPTESSIGSGETAAAEAEADTQEDNGTSTPGMRGRDVGIAIGTLALVSLMILAGIIFYKRRNRNRSNASHLERLPDEKNMPPEPPTFRLSTAPPLATGRGTNAAPRTQSSIMDEAMGAAYQHEAGFDEKAGYYGPQSPRYDVDKSEIPIGLGISHNGGYVPPQQDGMLSPGNPFTTRQDMYQPEPPQVPQPVAAPEQRLKDPYAALQAEAQHLQPPGRRMSAGGKTEITESSEGTWGTFAVERLRANDGKIPLKERLFGR